MQTILLVVTLFIGFGVTANPLAQEVHTDEVANIITDELQPIDINSAPIEQLTLLPGVGQKKAQAIIDHRQTHGRFDSLESLLQVKGIGERIAAKLEGKIRF